MTEQEIREFLLSELDKAADNIAVALKNKILSMTSGDTWVPVSESQPPKSGRYLVTIKSKAKRRTEMRNFDFESQTWESATPQPENILAWKERPAPYVPKE